MAAARSPLGVRAAGDWRERRRAARDTGRCVSAGGRSHRQQFFFFLFLFEFFLAFFFAFQFFSFALAFFFFFFSQVFFVDRPVFARFFFGFFKERFDARTQSFVARHRFGPLLFEQGRGFFLG